MTLHDFQSAESHQVTIDKYLIVLGVFSHVNVSSFDGLEHIRQRIDIHISFLLSLFLVMGLLYGVHGFFIPTTAK
jgi:hypothetical protein